MLQGFGGRDPCVMDGGGRAGQVIIVKRIVSIIDPFPLLASPPCIVRASVGRREGSSTPRGEIRGLEEVTRACGERRGQELVVSTGRYSSFACNQSCWNRLEGHFWPDLYLMLAYKGEGDLFNGFQTHLIEVFPMIQIAECACCYEASANITSLQIPHHNRKI